MTATLRQMIGRTASPILAGVSRLLPRAAGLTPPLARAAFLRRIPAAGRALEIGPFAAPKITRAGTIYVDVMDRDGLMARAASIGLDSAGCPPIDFIAPNGDLSDVTGPFDVIFSSHVIEHQPDLVRHLRQVESLLTLGGAYYLVIPDKRFCFDHYLPESSVAEICAAWSEQRRVHTVAAIVNHRLLTTHNGKLRHWLGLHGKKPAPHAASIESLKAECARIDPSAYVDVHAWYFTPATFGAAVETLRNLGLISLEVANIHDTLIGQFEFFAVLRKP
jgi:hypothetical protein